MTNTSPISGRMRAADAKNRFGELLTAAQREPVTIEKHGKPVAVVMSAADFELLQAVKLAQLQALIDEGLADAEAGRVLDGPETFRTLKERAR